MGKRVNFADLALDAVPDHPGVAAVQVGPASTLPVGDVVTNPLNNREQGDLMGEEFDQLVATIRDHGVLQPIVVCSAATFLERYPEQRGEVEPAAWVTLIGNRRLLATREAGLDRIPAVVNDERAATMYEVMLVENGVRRHLGPLREAEAMQQVLADRPMTTRDLGERIGRTHAYVVQRLALLGLIPALRQELEGGGLKLELARALGGRPVEEQEAVAAAGPPFRLRPTPAGNGVTSRRRTFVASTPQKAAQSIRELFSPSELDELIKLLIEPS